MYLKKKMHVESGKEGWAQTKVQKN